MHTAVEEGFDDDFQSNSIRIAAADTNSDSAFLLLMTHSNF